MNFNLLYEVSVLNNLPRKMKRDPQTKSTILKFNNIVQDNWCFICGSQLKNNKIRFICDFEQKTKIINDAFKKLDKQELKKLGIRIIK
jgi:hypothetical protein